MQISWPGDRGIYVTPNDLKQNIKQQVIQNKTSNNRLFKNIFKRSLYKNQYKNERTMRNKNCQPAEVTCKQCLTLDKYVSSAENINTDIQQSKMNINKMKMQIPTKLQ